MDDCLFCRIVRRESPARLVKEDDLALAFRDTNPQAPTHILIIPKAHIQSIDAARPEDEPVLGRLLLMAQVIAREEGIVGGYRLVFNNGRGAGQTVFHIHLHLLGGRPFRWPPG
ncbi:MAG: histidine triad nucleotide-binding protein [Acidobacteria bacterium]|nr:MAG: histidine triad nucleotide-binding protein [Acidobacteriota bacterium]